jgi:hypothetical protein
MVIRETDEPAGAPMSKPDEPAELASPADIEAALDQSGEASVRRRLLADSGLVRALDPATRPAGPPAGDAATGTEPTAQVEAEAADPTSQPEASERTDRADLDDVGKPLPHALEHDVSAPQSHVVPPRRAAWALAAVALLLTAVAIVWLAKNAMQAKAVNDLATASAPLPLVPSTASGALPLPGQVPGPPPPSDTATQPQGEPSTRPSSHPTPAPRDPVPPNPVHPPAPSIASPVPAPPTTTSSPIIELEDD